MEIGMLWFDDSARTLPEKVKRAAAYYAEKYGRTPTLCLVHPATLADGKEGRLGDVTLRSSRSVLPNHLLVGIDDRAAPARKAERGRAGRMAVSDAKAA